VGPRFSITKPCAKRWSDLPGDEQKRFCPDCQIHVHALEQLSPQQIESLRQESAGHLCGYLVGEPLVQPRSRRAVLVGAILTAISPLMAQSGRVRIRVMDETGALIPNAEVSLLGPDQKPVFTTRANESGEAVLTGLPIGDSRVSVSVRGFMTLVRIVTIQGTEELTVDATLKLGQMGDVAQVAPKKRRRWLIF